MYIRTKMISGLPYAYLVDNEWTSKGARQKIRSYLGRVHEVGEEVALDFLSTLKEPIGGYVRGSSRKKIVDELVLFELKKCGFSKVKRGYKKGRIRLDYGDEGFTKKIVLQINEGHLCNHTIQEIISFKAMGDEHKDGYALAERFVHAGIAIPKELFVAYFQKNHLKG
ncbi:hypothetical protein J4460_00130 [Candidatus Woesearchaeota archaeon]|nr:MAG: hypothetical protein QS99_C0002G0161 [archaeon GW2011_AR4]MBS3129057.1 hypothetical protein [Candidatus Woesearchaeota archaeon]HIH37791.1 hypothetical protein [Candidatus Woesearchaeota archaeon]HIH49526.1 hypothetical protein [Candidatus Woesearchaeota archaeon]HIJ03916.1 hypothetical protein [Candidatus Woesearchaeota archaeon]